MASEEVNAEGRGPLNWLRRHCRTIQIIAVIAFAFVMGLALGNEHKTEDAMAGQANYFVHDYTPKIAARAAGGAVRKARAACHDQD